MLFKIIPISNTIIKNFCKLSCEVGKLPRQISSPKCLWKSSNEIRSNFIQYFENIDHKYVEPCSVYNSVDGSYFVNSGVSQFKDHILNKNTKFSNITKAVNSQRCIRLGGKQCDLESIGYDSTHLSYFEMLGNWSFRSYNKKDACRMMWQYLTENLKLPPAHLYVTYFGGSEKLGLHADEETRDIWFNLGVKDSKLLQFGEKHNFWEMGDRSTNTLCGPCSEIHWDYLATFGETSDSRCARCFVNSGSSELIELWNCVFIQYQWVGGGRSLTSLDSLVIDSGMGLERLASVVQGVTGVFDTDNFSKIINRISDVSNAPAYEGTFEISNLLHSQQRTFENPKESRRLDTLRRDVAYRIIADHLRTLCICFHDGIQPGRQNLELKVRQLLHRAIRQSKYGLGMNGCLANVVETVCETLEGQISPNQQLISAIKQTIVKEEQFLLPKLEMYENTFVNFLKLRNSNSSQITEEEVIKINSGHFGYPISLNMIRAIAKDIGLNVQNVICDDYRDETVDDDTNRHIYFLPEEILTNKKIPVTDKEYVYNYSYDEATKLYITEDIETEILEILYKSPKNDKLVTDLKQLDSKLIGIVTPRTNMYANKGGQESDKGVILYDDEVLANVVKITELNSGHVIHWCFLVKRDTLIQTGCKIKLHVDPIHRTGTTLHHTSHHIIFAAINDLIGKCNQSSSSVYKDYAKLGFTLDFSCQNSITLKNPDFPIKLENMCNDLIAKNIPIEINENVEFASIKNDADISYTDFEKYPKQVRLISIGNKTEVCCGTHALTTSHLRNIVITSVKGINQTVTEISFVTGKNAIEIREKEKEYIELCQNIRSQNVWKNDEIDLITSKLHQIISNQKLSKSMRDIIKQSLHFVHLKKNKSPGTSMILRDELKKMKSEKLNACIFNAGVTSMRKIVNTIIDMDIRAPVMIWDNVQVLLHIPKCKLLDLVPKIFENIDQSNLKYTLQVPHIRNISSDILNEYILFTFSEQFHEVDQMKKNFEMIIENKKCNEK